MRKPSKIPKLSYLHQSSQSDRNKQSTGNLLEQFLLLLLWVFHAMHRLSCLQYCQGLRPLEASEQESRSFSICNQNNIIAGKQYGHVRHDYKDLFEVTDEPGHTFVAAGFMDAFTYLENFVLDRGSIPVQ